MTVPARHIGRIETRQGFGLDDNVLKNLVHRMADVNIAVRIRRAIVQDEFGPTGGHFADGLVAFLLLPRSDPTRFAFGQIAAHRERRVGQV